MSDEVMIGTVSDYFSHIGVAGIDLIDSLKKEDRIHIQGHTTDLMQTVESIQIDRKEVGEASAGQSVGVKVQERVRKGDMVFLVP
ncbi:translation elongation factor-like protein [Dehalogenimonas etheniformans]|uniref:Translation elongation factor-like protein n=1 Tax=Dehalogenimonas etheniformans TaxID=1536648 RepID=A0A2P5P5D2_9CHLR|nr:translation elongation factor-like protein [Dehalogenimonas etheniformans]PPD57512.1 translation elongation factor-like protein [Dehalogenimonas etheniformans]QNT76873.1 translation elongation factor-like protein [Dehalogenimonas etheniformans]